MAKQERGSGARVVESLTKLRSSIGRTVKRIVKRTVISAAGPIAERRARREDLADPAAWGLVRQADGALSVSGVPLRSLVEQHGSPLHVVDAGRLSAHVRAATSVGFGVAAAQRCTHVTGVVALVRSGGCKVSTASTYELDAALAAGAGVEELVHVPAVLSAHDLRRALSLGVGIVCVPSLRSLQSFGEIDRAVGRDGAAQSRIGLTIAIADVHDLGPRLADADTATCAQVTHLHVRASDRRLSTVELDDLVDDVAAAWTNAREALSSLVSLCVEVDLVPPTVSIIGGLDARLNQSVGLPVARSNGAGEALSITLRRFHDRLRSAGVDVGEIIIDPGSVITGGMQFTLATVLEVDDTRSVTHVVLDCGINIADDTLVERHELLAAHTDGANDGDVPLRPHRLVGPICTPADVLYANLWMPPTAAGDVLAIMDTGGPYVAESTTFSFPRPAVVAVDDKGQVEVLRRAETFDDLVALDSFEAATPAS